MIENRHNRRRVRHERAHALAARQPALHRLLFLMAAAVSLAIQILVVQIHVHGTPLTAQPQYINLAAVAHFAADGSAALVKTAIPWDRYPINDDPSNCPLCQEFAHSGQFVQSAAVLAYIPAWISVHFIRFSDLRPALLAFSHSWQGRAPPFDSPDVLKR
jgi:hypothetical protein